MSAGPQFRLRFPETAIRSWASRYPADYDAEVETHIAPTAKARGYLTRAEFLTLCRWKSPRTQPRCKENAEDFVAEITRIAFSSAHERVRIELLTLLRGVAWPTASAMLHFVCRDRCPVLDFRALWSMELRPYRISISRCGGHIRRSADHWRKGTTSVCASSTVPFGSTLQQIRRRRTNDC